MALTDREDDTRFVLFNVVCLSVDFGLMGLCMNLIFGVFDLQVVCCFMNGG